VRYFIVLFLFVNIVNAKYIEEIMDGTYGATEVFIDDTSNYLDKSFSREDYAVSEGSLNKGDIFYESVYEKGQDNINNSNIKIRLLFPRFRDKYKISLENYTKSKSIDDRKTSDDYLLGIADGKKRIGLKFRGIKPDLFVSYKIGKTFDINNDYSLFMENNAIYFADFGFDNTMQFNIKKELSSDTKISFDNSYRFTKLNDNKHEVVNSINIYNQLNSRELLSGSISSYATKDDIVNQSLEVDYYYSGISYKNHFYKNWGYFQVDTGLTFRDENDFEPRGRILFRIGALFGNAKPTFDN